MRVGSTFTPGPCVVANVTVDGAAWRDTMTAYVMEPSPRPGLLLVEGRTGWDPPVARIAVAPAELPVGVVTALVGVTAGHIVLAHRGSWKAPALIAAATRHGLRRPVLVARLAGWAFLLFAASDGALALLTLYALVARDRSRK